MIDPGPGYWCLLLGPAERLEMARGRHFEQYSDLLSFLAQEDFYGAVESEDRTLLFWAGIPPSPEVFYAQLTDAQRPDESAPPSPTQEGVWGSSILVRSSRIPKPA